MSAKKKENLSLLVFCAPALMVYIIFKLFPAISGVFYALTDWNGLNKTYHFIGIENFVELTGDNTGLTHIFSNLSTLFSYFH